MYTLSLTFLFFLIYRSNSFLPWSPGRGRETGWTSCSTRSEGVRQWEPLPAVRTLWFHFTLTTNLINSVVFVFICVYRRQWGSRWTEGGSVAAEGHEDEVPDDPQEQPGAGCRCWVSSSGLVSVDAVFVRGDRETVRPRRCQRPPAAAGRKKDSFVSVWRPGGDVCEQLRRHVNAWHGSAAGVHDFPWAPAVSSGRWMSWETHLSLWPQLSRHCGNWTAGGAADDQCYCLIAEC